MFSSYSQLSLLGHLRQVILLLSTFGPEYLLAASRQNARRLPSRERTLEGADMKVQQRKLLSAYVWFVWSAMVEFANFHRTARSRSIFMDFLRSYDRMMYYHAAARSPAHANAQHFFLAKDRFFQKAANGKAMEEYTVETGVYNQWQTWGLVFETREMLYAGECSRSLQALRFCL